MELIQIYTTIFSFKIDHEKWCEFLQVSETESFTAKTLMAVLKVTEMLVTEIFP